MSRVAVFFLTVFFLPTVLLANNLSQLKTIKHQIVAVKQAIQNYQNKKQTIQSDLKNTEKQIGIIEKSIQEKKQQIAEQKKELYSTNIEHNNYTQKLNQQKILLAEQIRSAYILGREPYLKILLNQENPEQISRFLEYYRYLNNERVAVINSIKTMTKKISDTAKKIKVQTQSLSKAQNDLFLKQNLLTSERAHRMGLLRKTNSVLNTQKKRLESLLHNKQYFEKVIQTINLQRSYGYAPGKTFSQMRGKLHWPIPHGKIEQSFNQYIIKGRLRSTGILIKSKAGEDVRAIFSGKVVFADWLNGFGLLAIIQHGDYLTLFARNQSLYVKTGDIVNPGQVIATVGSSGGFHESALYFEIRKGDQPLDPLTWLS